MKRPSLRRVSRIAEAVTVSVAIAVISVSAWVLWVLAVDPERGEAWTSGLRPVQFYRDFEAELLDDYAQVFAVAHNSGDEVSATLDAVAAGADVIEVDVVAVDGRLYAAHGTPLFWIGDSLFRAPLLERVWTASAGADAIKLDLKDSSPAFLDAVFQFLDARRGQRPVIIVSSDPDVLRAFAVRAPEVYRFLGVSYDERFRLLEEDPTFAEIVDGVSVRHGLLDAERAAWLEERELLTLAWTVNNLERVNELVLLGVDAITTDNLAIMKLLGGQQRGETRLSRLRTDTGPLEEPVTWVGVPGVLTGSDGQRLGQGRTRSPGRRGRSTTPGPHLPRRSSGAQCGRSSRRRTG